MTRLVDRLLPEEVLRFVDNWRFWISLAFFALAAISVWLAVVTMRTAQTSARTAREQAIRQATIGSDYKACVRSIPNIGRVNRFLGGVNDLADILVQNGEASLAAASPDDPLNPTREENLVRLRRAQAKVATIRSFPVPTVASCEARRQAAESAG